MVHYLQTFWGILLEIAPFVLLGMLAAGFVHEALGRFQRLRAFALKRSLGSLSFFNFVGLTLPICSCGVIPLAVGLRRQGVPFGNLFAFIYAAPVTSIAAVILSGAVLGVDFTLFYVVGAILCGYIVGGVFYAVERPAVTLPDRGTLYLCSDDASAISHHGFFLKAIRWGTVTYGSRIAFDLIVGLALAALLVSTYSIQALGSWLGDQPFWWGALLTILVAIPLYVCSLPGILVAGTLVLGGFPPALVWMFLMAGPVTNLGDINVMRRNLGWRNTLLYVALVVVVTLLWGWVIQVNLEWQDMWAHVREYYVQQVNLAGFDGEIAGALSQSTWLGMPRELHYAAALMLVFFTLNGARLALQELWISPCIHCRHFQDDLRLNPAICRRPCWKNRLLRRLKGSAATLQGVPVLQQRAQLGKTQRGGRGG